MTLRDQVRSAPPSGDGVRVYVASPLGFSAPGRLWNEQVLLPSLSAAGLTALDPWSKVDHISRAMQVDDPAERLAALQEANRIVGRLNEEMIRGCVGLIAILDGTDVDSGTAAEIGFAAALGLVLVGLKTDVRVCADNVGSKVNLQIEHWIRESGGAIHESVAAAAVTMKALLDGRSDPAALVPRT